MPAKTCAASHSPSGCNSQVARPTQSASVERSSAALPCVDRRLPVERGMVRILGDQHVRQEPRTRPAALDRQRRHRRLVHALAGAAGEAGTDVPDHLEPRRLVVENFRDVLTDDVQLAAARRTAAAIRFMPALLPAANDRAVAAGHFSSRNRLLAPSPVRGRASPAMRRAVPRLQAQRRLIGMALLRGAAEALPFQRREEQLQLLDFAVPIGQPWLRSASSASCRSSTSARSRTTRLVAELSD